VEEPSVKIRFASVLAAVLLAGAPHASAQIDPDMRDHVIFSVSRGTKLANDEMTVVFAATHTAVEAAEAADQVNRDIRWARDQIGDDERFRVRSGSYATHETLTPQKQKRWRAQQKLIVASKDFDALRTLVGTLQARVNLQSVGFALTPEARIETERGLVKQALEAFREEAELIRTSLGASGYAIVELRLNMSAQDPQRQYSSGGVVQGGVSRAAVAPPVLEGGSSDVFVHVHARIQLE
jgi:predicted secreted protein